ncbi:uncharacterized protein LOC134189251 [Corticium candelabrum]|uniref:uncharacterized protein LOC134189251 n=1 Tax=Corticium candelabrum TaxID=121492 RepID=UPI002E27176C|nr:uncharacterized protein LOC134189251 [Corticium candelabrum]
MNFGQTKGKGSFEAFCKILNNEEKQKHVVSKILKVSSEALLSVHISESPIITKQTVESEDHGKISSSRKQSRVEPTPDMESLSTKSKNLRVDETIRSATFTFRKEDEERIKPWENLLIAMCQQCFKMLEDDVIFLYCLPSVGQKVTFYGDVDYKLAVFQLDDVAPSLISKHKSRLISHIAGFLKVKKNLIHYLEVLDGSALVLFRIEMSAYVRLLAAPAMEAQCIAFYQTLKQTFPKLVAVKFKLGGLPTIPLTNAGIKIQGVMSKEEKEQKNLRKVYAKLANSNCITSVWP